MEMIDQILLTQDEISGVLKDYIESAQKQGVKLNLDELQKRLNVARVAKMFNWGESSCEHCNPPTSREPFPPACRFLCSACMTKLANELNQFYQDQNAKPD